MLIQIVMMCSRGTRCWQSVVCQIFFIKILIVSVFFNPLHRLDIKWKGLAVFLSCGSNGIKHHCTIIHGASTNAWYPNLFFYILCVRGLEWHWTKSTFCIPLPFIHAWRSGCEVIVYMQVFQGLIKPLFLLLTCRMCAGIYGTDYLGNLPESSGCTTLLVDTCPPHSSQAFCIN